MAETFNAAMASFQAGRLQEADRGLQQVLSAAPTLAPAWHLRGLVSQAARRLPEARLMIERAIELDGTVADYHANLAAVLIGLQSLDDALAATDRALALLPDHFAGLVNRGLVLTERGQLSAALEAFERALRGKPEVAQIHGNVGKVNRLLGRYAASLAAYERANTLAPHLAEYALGRAMALYMTGRTPDARRQLDAAAQQWPNHLEILSARTFVLNYFADVTADQQAAAARAYGTALAARVQPQVHVPDPAQADRPIRVGLVSADLREHSVSHFLRSVLPHIPRTSVTLVAYSVSRHADAVTDQLKGMVEEWVDAFPLDPAALARRMVADRIDVLLDLSGHTQGHRLPIFAAKPAPVSASWLGYSGTTGLTAIDYLVADAVVAPEGDEAHLSERPWRLPHGFVCFPPSADRPPSRPKDRSGIVFGSFNSHNKLSDATAEAWAAILRAVPDGRLILKSRAMADAGEREATLARFGALGIAAERLTLLDRTPTVEAHLALYGEIDIALDSFPYNGTTTTMQALRMGVPVLTLRGDRYISRVGESILTHAGLTEWVAADVDAYIAQAVRWAHDPAGLEAARRDLPARLAAAPIVDAAQFGQSFEAMLRGMWRHWCLSGSS